MNYVEIPKELYADCLEHPANTGNGLWLEICYHIGENAPYEQKKLYFLSTLHKLMHEGYIKLARDGEFLTGSIDAQVQRFAAAWPDEKELLDCQFELKTLPSSDENDFDIWTPAGFVWCDVDEDTGEPYEEWDDFT